MSFSHSFSSPGNGSGSKREREKERVQLRVKLSWAGNELLQAFQWKENWTLAFYCQFFFNCFVHSNLGWKKPPSKIIFKGEEMMLSFCQLKSFFLVQNNYFKIADAQIKSWARGKKILLLLLLPLMRGKLSNCLLTEKISEELQNWNLTNFKL